MYFLTVSKTRLLAFFLATNLLILGACSSAQQQEPVALAAALPGNTSSVEPSASSDSLYVALGGAVGLELLADNFLIELAENDRVRHRFEQTDIGRFHSLFQTHICHLTGGSCVYRGDTMKRAHGGMNIQSSEFNSVVESLMLAMNETGLSPGVQNRLLAILAGLRPDIVGQ